MVGHGDKVSSMVDSYCNCLRNRHGNAHDGPGKDGAHYGGGPLRSTETFMSLKTQKSVAPICW